MKTTKSFNRKSLAVAIGGVLASSSPVAMAQSSDNASEALEEIMVTATRREARVQDIPYNISAMSGEFLELQNAVDQYDVLRAMHGVTVVDRGYRNAGMVNSIVIRGLNVDNGINGDIMLNAVPTVATYYDNSPGFANFLIKDIERVEVLRGPQGTLYGSGSLGGTVRYIGNKPDPEAFATDLELDYGQTSGSGGNNVALDAMFNIPLGDTTAIRLNYSRIDNDGVIDYVNAYQLNNFREPLVNVDGNCVDPRSVTDEQLLFNVGCFESVEDADTVEIDYAKIALRGEPSDTFNYQLTYQTQDDKIGARRSTTLGDNNQPAGTDLYFSYGDDDSGQVLLEPSEREVEMASLDLEWDLGFATFTSTTSSYDHTGMGESDNGALWASGGEVDGTSRDWNTNYYGGQWPRPAQRAERGYDDEIFTQEFRLVSNETEGNIDWIVGAFYLDQDNSVYQLSWNPGMNLFKNACRATGDPICTINGFFGGFWPRFYAGDLTEIDFEYVRDTAYEEKAIYGELTYHVSDTFRLTGGLRWFDNETVNDTKLGFPIGPDYVFPPSPQSTDKDDDILVKINASWDLNDNNMLYATYSEGYRHGGAQSVPDDGPFAEDNALALRTFDSDSVRNYEIGLKGDSNGLLYTVSLFHVDWDDPQLNYTSNIGFYLAGNGDAASTQGVELEVEGNVTDSLHFRVGYTYVDAELDKDFFSPQNLDLIAPAGSRLPVAPEHTLSFNVDNRWEIGANLDLVAAFNAYYQSETGNYLSDAGPAYNQFYEEFDSFLLMGANASLVSDHWSATLYVKNLSDEAAPTGAFPVSYFSYDTGNFEYWYGNGNRQFIVQPLTVGLKFRYRF